MSSPSTLLDKLWHTHEILRRDDGSSLLWVDRHLVHEGSHHAFARLAAREAQVAEPALTLAVADHYAPTRDRLHIADAASARMIATLAGNARQHGIELLGLDDPRQGIVHVVGPELGLTLPGLLIVCGDSHTSTHGAFGALAFGIGATEVAHVLATQTLWQKKPEAMRITVNGALGEGVTAKDLALHWIAALGAGGARGHAIEYAGEAVTSLSMEARMTLCNLSIEGGARFGLIAPDAVTLGYVRGRPRAPSAADRESATAHWKTLASDPGAAFEREVTFEAADIAPHRHLGNQPCPGRSGRRVRARPRRAAARERRRDARAALEYMALSPGQALEGVPVDPGLPRLVHQRPAGGSACRGKGPPRPQVPCARPRLAGLERRQGRG